VTRDPTDIRPGSSAALSSLRQLRRCSVNTADTWDGCRFTILEWCKGRESQVVLTSQQHRQGASRFGQANEGLANVQYGLGKRAAGKWGVEAPHEPMAGAAAQLEEALPPAER
jgi:hypothetical protein